VLDGLLVADASAFFALQRCPAERAVIARLAQLFDVAVDDCEKYLALALHVLSDRDDAAEGVEIGGDQIDLGVARPLRGDRERHQEDERGGG
jgi:hypothetical protein